jgi:hypothetical protein
MARSRCWLSSAARLARRNAASELRSGRLPETSALWSRGELPGTRRAAPKRRARQSRCSRALPELGTRRLAELRISEKFQPYDRTIWGSSPVCLVLRPRAGKPFE